MSSVHSVSSVNKTITMMKKTYIIPVTEVSFAEAEQIIAASITEIGGDSGLKRGEGDTPDNADAKEFDFFGEEIF